jgi:hypothetical protein
MCDTQNIELRSRKPAVCASVSQYLDPRCMHATGHDRCLEVIAVADAVDVDTVHIRLMHTIYDTPWSLNTHGGSTF